MFRESSSFLSEHPGDPDPGGTVTQFDRKPALMFHQRWFFFSIVEPNERCSDGDCCARPDMDYVPARTVLGVGSPDLRFPRNSR